MPAIGVFVETKEIRAEIRSSIGMEVVVEKRIVKRRRLHRGRASGSFLLNTIATAQWA